MGVMKVKVDGVWTEVDSTALSVQQTCGFHAYRGAPGGANDFQIDTGVWSPIGFDAVHFLRDVGTWRTATVGQMKVPSTQPAGRWYRITANAQWNGAATSGTLRQISLRHNGTLVDGVSGVQSSVSAYSTLHSLYIEKPLNPGDTVELWSFQHSGGWLAVQGARFGVNEILGY